MFDIKYHLSYNTYSDITKADESDLRYNLFLGNLVLKTQSQSIIIDWDWIPLLDFAFCLLTISNNLSAKMRAEEEFEFTESDAKIYFQKNNDKIKIVVSFSDKQLEISFEEFKTGVHEFYKNLVFEIITKDKEIKNNILFLEYLKEAEKL